MFSRAEILKGLDKSKVSRKAFIKKELTENPEFFKAFPHMQSVLNVEAEDDNKGGPTSQDKISENPKYFNDVQLGFKDPTGKSDKSYFESLLDHHNQYMSPTQKEEAIRDNERNFIEAYASPTGPMKWLSKEQLEKVHAQIDIKMQELEDSGLTREEVLYDNQVRESDSITVDIVERHSLVRRPFLLIRQE